MRPGLSLRPVPTESKTYITLIFSYTFAAFATNICCRADFPHFPTKGTSIRILILQFVSYDLNIVLSTLTSLPYGPYFVANIHYTFTFTYH